MCYFYFYSFTGALIIFHLRDRIDMSFLNLVNSIEDFQGPGLESSGGSKSFYTLSNLKIKPITVIYFFSLIYTLAVRISTFNKFTVELL